MGNLTHILFFRSRTTSRLTSGRWGSPWSSSRRWSRPTTRCPPCASSSRSRRATRQGWHSTLSSLIYAIKLWETVLDFGNKFTALRFTSYQLLCYVLIFAKISTIRHGARRQPSKSRWVFCAKNSSDAGLLGEVEILQRVLLSNTWSWFSTFVWLKNQKAGHLFCRFIFSRV